MKKAIGMLLCIGLVVGFSGCGKKTEVSSVAAPTALTLAVAGADSLSLKLTWTASTDTADGYIVYLNDAALDTVTACEYTHQPTELGDYEVIAYIGATKSDAAEATSNLETATPGSKVYWMAAATAVGNSGYGWSATGSGADYSMSSGTAATEKAMTDFYVDSVYLTKGTDKIISPDNYYTTEGWNATWFYNCSGNVYDTLSVAPGWAQWKNYSEVTAVNNTIVLYVKDSHYVKIQITVSNSTGDHYVELKYGFQKIAGFRRLK
ncbi:MAG: hypothetical protein PHX21_01885 [bacterium]|nr:hypothetical protein [bacterium]